MLCVSKVYFTVIEFKVWLWNRIRIAEYFPALMLPEASSSKLEQEVSKHKSRLRKFLSKFDPSILRLVVLKLYQTSGGWNDAATEPKLGS